MAVTGLKELVKILALAVKEGLELWKTYIATRQQAYERKMDKRQEKAIQYAEQSFESMNEMFNFISAKVTFSKEDQKEYDRIKTEIYKLKGKFNKYD